MVCIALAESASASFVSRYAASADSARHMDIAHHVRAEPKWASIECVESVVHGTNGVRPECTLIGSTAARPLAFFFYSVASHEYGTPWEGRAAFFPCNFALK